MNSTLEQPEVRAYLEKLQHLLAGSPDREAVLDDITLHIQTAAAHDRDDPELARRILNQLGDPAAIAASASPAPSSRAVRPALRRGASIAVVLLLAVGGLAIPAFGWGIAGSPLFAPIWLTGIVLLWITSGWTTIDKALGTLAVPVLLAVAFLVEQLTTQTDPSAAIDFAVLAGYAVLTIAVSSYLLARFRPSPR